MNDMKTLFYIDLYTIRNGKFHSVNMENLIQNLNQKGYSWNFYDVQWLLSNECFHCFNNHERGMLPNNDTIGWHSKEKLFRKLDFPVSVHKLQEAVCIRGSPTWHNCGDKIPSLYEKQSLTFVCNVISTRWCLIAGGIRKSGTFCWEIDLNFWRGSYLIIGVHLQIAHTS